MIKVFNVYYSIRTVARLLCEIALACGSFLLATVYIKGPDTYIALFYESGLLKIICLSVLTLLLTYYFDLYEPQRISRSWEIYFRLLLVVSLMSFSLAAVLYLFPSIDIGPNVSVLGVMILAVALIAWRAAYEWAIGLSAFSEKVYVLGNGKRAKTVIDILRSRRDTGMEVVAEELTVVNPDDQHDFFSDALRKLGSSRKGLERVIVAMEDRRGSMPVRELLNMRFNGVIVEDANNLIERILGKLPLDGLNPSTLIFSDGFYSRASQQVLRRLMSMAVSLTALLICLPFIPLIMLAVKLSSPGPIFYRQTRVGLNNHLYSVIKFRTMRQDAELNGAVWAAENDPRITRLGKFMRKTRLDEIPQLWNVLRGEMAFVGPRPERPEFVEWLSREIPLYELRHMIRPGITGWAQVRYRYGASLEDTKNKLEYDLYYVKHQSVGLDLLIMFETVKTIILRRGAQ
jgi:sugar transferase (PEP-CTERM system associated)